MLTDKQHRFLQALNEMLVEYQTLPVDDRGPYMSAVSLSFRIYPDQYIDSTAEDVVESIGTNRRSNRIAAPPSRQLPGARQIGRGDKPSELTGLPQPRDIYDGEE